MSPVFDEAKYRALLEKLEICIIKNNELERSLRIDAEFYKKENLMIANKLKLLGAIPITNYLNVSDGNHMAISEKFIESGIPYYRGQDINHFFIENSTPICIDDDSFQSSFMKRSHLQLGDILLSIIGTIGGISLVTSTRKATCSCKLAILRCKQNYSSEIFAAFLYSKFGQNQIKKFIRGAVQMGFLLEDMDQILIPEFSKFFIDTINTEISYAQNKQKESIDNYVLAEQLLLQELGLMNWQPDDESVATKTFADLQNSGRLDAEYYQPKYDEYLAKVKSYSGGVSTLANHFEQNKTTTTFSLPQYNYIEIGDINVSNGEASFNLVQTEELPANAKYVIQQGDILISKVRPYRGAVSIIDFEPQNVIASGAFTILRENGAIRKEVLSTLLRTPLYKDWLLKWNVGSSYPVIKDEDILNLTIPVIKQEIQDQIAAKVQESFALRKESKRLLNLAKHAVEVAIEQGEDAAMKLLEN